MNHNGTKNAKMYDEIFQRHDSHRYSCSSAVAHFLFRSFCVFRGRSFRTIQMICDMSCLPLGSF